MGAAAENLTTLVTIVSSAVRVSLLAKLVKVSQKSKVYGHKLQIWHTKDCHYRRKRFHEWKSHATLIEGSASEA